MFSKTHQWIKNEDLSMLLLTGDEVKILSETEWEVHFTPLKIGNIDDVFKMTKKQFYESFE